MKKLWLLCPIDENSPPWTPWYDKVFGFVIRAESEQEARQVTESRENITGDEVEAGYVNHTWTVKNNPWLDPKLSSCTEITALGDSEVIIRDYRSA